MLITNQFKRFHGTELLSVFRHSADKSILFEDYVEHFPPVPNISVPSPEAAPHYSRSFG
jgi:hypothetical protein